MPSTVELEDEAGKEEASLARRPPAPFGRTRLPQQRQCANRLVGCVTHPISAHGPHVRFRCTKGPEPWRDATPQAREVFRFAPWKTIDRFEKVRPVE